jgi:hypothetical protein
MSDMRHLLDIINESEFYKEDVEIGDNFDLEIGEDLLIETYVVDIEDDKIIIESDDQVLKMLEEYGVELVDEGYVIRGKFPSFIHNKPNAEKIDYQGLYKEFVTSQNFKLADKKGQLSTDDNWLKLATGYLKSKGYDKTEPFVLHNMANRLYSMHKAYTTKPAAESKISGILEGITRAPMRMGTGGGDAADAGTRTLGEGFSDSREIADMIVTSLGGEDNISSDDIYAAIDEYQSMMDSPHKLDVDEVAQIVMDKLHGVSVPDMSETKHDMLDEEPVGKIEINGKPVNLKSLEVDGVDTRDYPDFSDAYLTYAEFEDGTPLSDDEIELFQNKHDDLVYQVAYDSLFEAKYQGREVPLGKPMAGDVKKSKVYVRGPKGNVVKVNFGDKKMKIKKSNPKRRKSFRARHNCKNPGPRWKARYWSCRAW